MQEHNFDEILDFLCSGIMSKSERQSVRDELYDHLMCRYETNLAVGMDKEKATENAINDLGDKTAIKHRLSQVHSYYPKLSMKKAMNLLTVGFVLSSLRIPLFTGMKEIFVFLGSVVMLVAMFCLRTANKKLNQAFYVQIAVFALRVVSTVISVFYFNGFNITVPFEIAINLIDIVFWLLALYGLHELVKPYIKKEKSSKLEDSDLRLGSLAFIIAVTNLLIIYINIMYFIDRNFYETRIDRIFISIGSILGLGLHALPKISKLLWNSDHEYKIEDSARKKWVAAILAFAVAVVPVVAVDLYVSTEKAETEVYSINDCDISDAEYDRICNNLISYGFVEEFIYALPKSEIALLKDSVPREELGNELFEERTHHYKKDSILVSVYCGAVGYVDEKGNCVARYMTFIEYSNNVKQKCTDYITMDRVSSVPLNYDKQYNGDLFLILSEENSMLVSQKDCKLIRNEPLEIYIDPNYQDNRISGVKYEVKDRMLIYYGTTYERDIGQIGDNLYLRLYHRTFPLTSMRKPPERGQYLDDIIGFEPFTIETLHYIAFPKEEYDFKINQQ